MDVLDTATRRVTLGAQVGRTGGEGTVFEVQGRPSVVAKLYRDRPDASRVSKLRYLAQKGNDRLRSFAAWPSEMLMDRAGVVCGFIMPKVSGKEIHQLFTNKERVAEFPGMRWDFLLHVARNCAAAFDEIHHLGIVLGDINEGNILVRPDGTVTLIDCDSCQAELNGTVWTCDVGVPMWTAPEHQGRSFRGLRRRVDSDLFGLAALVFRLLFVGRHPYIGVHSMSGDYPLERAIADFAYVFSDTRPPVHLKPPPWSLPVSAVTPELRMMFDRAFLRGSEPLPVRPAARIWVEALERQKSAIRQCTRRPSHVFWSQLSTCPWCAIRDGGGPDYFPAEPIAGRWWEANQELLRRVDNCVEINPLHGLLAGESLPKANPTPLPPPDRVRRRLFDWGIVLASVALLMWVGQYGLPASGVLMIALGMLCRGRYTATYEPLRMQRASALVEAENELSKALEDLDRCEQSYVEAFREARQAAVERRDRLLRLKDERSAILKDLETKKRDLLRDAFLDTQLLSRARIPGIGSKRIQLLLAHGIETALDVPKSHAVPGIGSEFFSRLMSWRQECQAKFVYKATDLIPSAELQRVNERFQQLGARLESEIEQQTFRLNSLNDQLSTARPDLLSRVKACKEALAQAKADYDSIPTA
jgi:DNA-binding helix-hairpin-helix protein with protein kinase domain